MNYIGIHCALAHDSSACLVNQDQLVYACAEERHTRRCHDSAFPRQAITAALNAADISSSKIDCVSFSWSDPYKSVAYRFLDIFRAQNPLRGALSFVRGATPMLLNGGGARTYRHFFGKTRILHCDHHLAHAISAYAYSDFEEATVVVVDGKGAFEASSIWLGRNGTLTPVEIIKWPNSIGLLYAKFTAYLGFQPLSDEWKVMGLAAYGEPGIDLSPFISYTPEPYQLNTKRFNCSSITGVEEIEAVLGPRRGPSDPIEQRHKDIAYAVQSETEQAMLRFVRYAVGKTGIKSICLAGGVAMNCKANGLIANDDSVERIFIQPAASDDGAALGAALYPYLLFDGKLPSMPMRHSYLGEQFSAEEIEESLQKYKLGYERMSNRSATIAELLADNKIIGHFNNRMEFGARALGNRSIIADPRHEDMKDRINDSVKYREAWRPFAPSILEEQYFDFFDTRTLSPFMILSFPVRAEKQDAIRAATHVDGTARPQSVSKQTNPDYWELINAFYQKTGVPVVVNTSFNLKGEPIVRTPFDAIRTFYTSGLDALVLGDYLLLK